MKHHFNDLLSQELNLLMRFPDSTLDGLKIHHTAESDVIEAAERLFNKGLTSQVDGGYLTELGHEALETAQLLISLVSPADK